MMPCFLQCVSVSLLTFLLMPFGFQTEELSPEVMVGKAIEACGGPKSFRAIRNVSWRGKMRVNMLGTEQTMDYRILMAFPDRLRFEFGPIIQLGNSSQFWILTPVRQPVPDDMRKELFDGMWRELPYLFARTDTPGMQLRYEGEESFDGQTCHIIKISPPKVKAFYLYLTKNTFKPAGITHEFKPPGAGESSTPVLSRVSYSDFRQVSGVWLPYSVRIFHDKKFHQEISVSEIQINAEIPESEFSWDK